jgi:hypothetical protein
LEEPCLCPCFVDPLSTGVTLQDVRECITYPRVILIGLAKISFYQKELFGVLVGFDQGSNHGGSHKAGHRGPMVRGFTHGC